MDSKGQEADSLPDAHSCNNGESEVSDVGSLPRDHVLGLHFLGLLKKVHIPKAVEQGGHLHPLVSSLAVLGGRLELSKGVE